MQNPELRGAVDSAGPSKDGDCRGMTAAGRLRRCMQPLVVKN
jgi:hypothetical protein